MGRFSRPGVLVGVKSGSSSRTSVRWKLTDSFLSTKGSVDGERGEIESETRVRSPQATRGGAVMEYANRAQLLWSTF